jgi:hypothetical protein
MWDVWDEAMVARGRRERVVVEGKKNRNRRFPKTLSAMIGG